MVIVEHTRGRRRVLRDLLGVDGLLAADVLAGASQAGKVSSGARPVQQLAATTEALSTSLYTAVLRDTTFDIGVSATVTLHQVPATKAEHLREFARLGGIPGGRSRAVSEGERVHVSATEARCRLMPCGSTPR